MRATIEDLILKRFSDCKIGDCILMGQLMCIMDEHPELNSMDFMSTIGELVTKGILNSNDIGFILTEEGFRYLH